ncbi:cytochrome c family protein [Acetobacter okinawensis]|uniref:cystathionine beta-lyase n=1 Tax=Acetobacter okinawensis TaxID=1076594 RepID=UPI00209EB2CA|nr:cystathionine beta-lyase [Acetobacter okinawensis]MCP1213429.1 cystathionine beta-lyase [Acetobacter okinawensis]
MRAALLRCLLPACAVVGVLLAGAVRTHAAVGTPQPPVALHTVPDAVAGATTLSHTQSVYVSHCGGCHGIEGISGPTFVPTLRNSVGSFACTPEGRAYLVRVPGVSMSLIRDDQTLADVMNFVLITLGGSSTPPDFKPYTAAEVHAWRAHPLSGPDFMATRAHVLERALAVCAHGPGAG